MPLAQDQYHQLTTSSTIINNNVNVNPTITTTTNTTTTTTTTTTKATDTMNNTATTIAISTDTSRVNQSDHQYVNHNIEHHLPQTQAIITTTEENGWSISLANFAANQLFGYEDMHDFVDMDILDLIDTNYHHLLLSEITARRKALSYNGGVLICGEVVSDIF